MTCCPDCGNGLYVRKTVERKVITMHIGQFEAKETVLYCPACSCGPIHSEELASLVPSGANFGYDIMVHVGIARFQHHRSEEEIVAELMEHNVNMSTGEVRNLSVRFASFLGIAHREAGPAIADHLALNGGYIIHLDSTSRINSRKLMSGIDEVSGLVLLNIRLTSETAENIIGFLRELIQAYGKPLAIASDMAASIRKAISDMPELNGIPHFICHFHFLRDAGKDLLQEDYRDFEKRLESHGVVKVLGDFRKSMEEQLSHCNEAIEAFMTSLSEDGSDSLSLLEIPVTVALLADSALYSRRQSNGLGFPFDRPAISFYEHLLRINSAMNALSSRNNLDSTEERLLTRISRPLTDIAKDRTLASMAKKLRSRGAVFEELRTAMQFAPEDTDAGLNYPGAGQDVDITRMESAVKIIRDGLDTSVPELLKLQEQIDRHWHGLFHAPIVTTDSCGDQRVIYPHRTNNILEQFFRSLNHGERKKTGIELSTSRFDAIPLDSLLAQNLKNPAYRAILLDGATDLAERFSRIDVETVRAELEEAKRGKSVYVSPRKTKKVLGAPTTPLEIAVSELSSQIKLIRLDAMM
jgi:hypothetical protein